MKVEEIFENFKSKKVLVVGDVMIDSYMLGNVTRISPEAPVPIISLNKIEDRLGGAANVAINIAALGAQPILCSVIGKDQSGEDYLRIMNDLDLPTDGIVQSENAVTTRKTRVIGDNQHLLRIDEEKIKEISEEQEDLLLGKIKSLIETGVDAVILEDYNKGVLTPKVIEKTITIANEAGLIITVDPKKDNFFKYKNVTMFKPNLKELKEGVKMDFDIKTDKSSFENAVEILQKELNNTITFVTLSEHGVFVGEKDKKNYLPAHIRNIADVSGAGDTVISVATLCLTIGLSAEKMASYANLAGGLVCELSGVVPIDKETLKQEIQNL